MKNRKKRYEKLKRIFIFINVAFILLILIFIFYVFFYERSSFAGRAISEFEEGGTVKESLEKTINLDYEKGLEKEIKFLILNNEHKNMQVLISAEGELNDSIILYDSLVEFLPSEESKTFKYKLILNRKLEPGVHKAKIIALEIPKASSEGVYASSALKIASELNVYVPYPGKYIDAKLNIMNAEQNQTADFVVSITNRGKENIEKAKAIIEIYTLLNEKADAIETDFVNLNIGAGEEKEIPAKWNVKVYAGDYIARYKIDYDGNIQSFEKKFAIGAKNLSIQGILVNNFQLGEIAKLQILVENKWNQELTEVFANLIVYNSKGEVIADIKSSEENIPSLLKKELIAYWDSANVEEGEYTGKIIVKYSGSSAEKSLTFKISQNSIDIFGVGYAVRPRIMSEATLTTILIVAVVLLLIMNFFWFIYFNRVIRKK